MATGAIATLGVSVVARTKKFKKGMKSAQWAVRRFGSSVRRAARSVVRFGATLTGVAVGGGFAAMTTSAAASIDALAKVATKLGAMTERLGGLHLVALQSGVAIRTFNMGLQRMTRRIAEAAKGTGEAREAIVELGLDAKSLAKMLPGKQLMAIADAMGQVASQSDRVRLGFKLFDSEGVALINTLRGGSTAMMGTIRAAKALGVTFSEEDAARVEAMNDAFTRFGQAVRGVAQKIAIAAAPQLRRFANILTGLVLTVRATDFSISESTIKWAKFGLKLGVAATAVVSTLWAFRKIKTAILAASVAMRAFTTSVIMLASTNPATLFANIASLAVGAGVALSVWNTAHSRLKDAQEIIDSLEGTGSLIGGMTDFMDEFVKGMHDAGAAANEAAQAAANAANEAAAAELRMANATMKMQSRAQAITLGVRTPREIFGAAFSEVADLMLKGLVTVETFDRRVVELGKNLRDALGIKLTAGLEQAAEWMERIRTPAEVARDSLKEIQELYKAGAFAKLGGADAMIKAMSHALKEFAGVADMAGQSIAIPQRATSGLMSTQMAGGVAGARALAKAESIQSSQMSEMRKQTGYLKTIATRATGGMAP